MSSTVAVLRCRDIGLLWWIPTWPVINHMGLPPAITHRRTRLVELQCFSLCRYSYGTTIVKIKLGERNKSRKRTPRPLGAKESRYTLLDEDPCRFPLCSSHQKEVEIENGNEATPNPFHAIPCQPFPLFFLPRVVRVSRDKPYKLLGNMAAMPLRTAMPPGIFVM
ncbi:hypothetical protein LY78DRAFT_222674 [Colletotrichum sublineola]|nr:hypothetical protein LY78DRAFT_222674 [Colletotrichum sublineola]